MADGRFAPSPTGPLHLGNLRTALVAWLFARSTGSRFILRVEDLDRRQSSVRHEQAQQGDLRLLGIDWDGPVVRQSDRFDRYEAAISDLEATGRTYPCFCTRREIQEATQAPHGEAPDGAYPGTCRDLDSAARGRRAREGRPAALRLRADIDELEVDDLVLGKIRAKVDDLVLRRNDGVPAYNLAVVVDDGSQGIGEVVRGEDLATSAPRQRYLGALLGLPPLAYAHVPLVVGADGARLAKRHGAVTLADQLACGAHPGQVLSRLAESLGLPADGDTTSIDDLVGTFEPRLIRSGPTSLGRVMVC